MSLVDRVRDRFGQDQAAVEAADLSLECSRPGCVRIEELKERGWGRVTGTVHSLAVPPQGSPPQLRVELYDGSGVLGLVWLGRSSINGIEPGSYLTVTGRVAATDDRLVMYNPGYDLLPAHV